MKKIQLPAIGGIRKVIEIPDAGTTIAEIGSGTITLPQLAKLITVAQQNQTAPTSNLVGTGNEASLKLGTGLSGGGVLLGTVVVRLDPGNLPGANAFALMEDAAGGGPDFPHVVPGPTGARGAAGLPIPMYPDDPDDPQVIPGTTGATGATGAAGAAGVSVPIQGEDGEDALPPIPGITGPRGAAGLPIPMYPDDPDDPQVIPGTAGATGATGAAGAAGAAGQPIPMYPDDPDDPQVIPGTAGATGATGATGAAGQPIPMYPDDPDDPQVIPGTAGAVGATGAAGASGSNGYTIPLQGEDGEDAFPHAVYGPQGATGSNGYTVPVYADDPDDPLVIPGQTGATGAQGPAGTSATSTGIPVLLNDFNEWDEFASQLRPPDLVLPTLKVISSVVIGPPSSGAALTVSGSNSAYSVSVKGGSGTGTSFGVSVQAGTTAGDTALNISNYAGSTLLLVNGLGQTTLNQSSSGVGNTLTVNGNNSNYGLYVKGGSGTNTSFGLYLQAGTSSSDNALLIANYANAQLLSVSGDGNVLVTPTSGVALNLTAASSSYALIVNGAASQYAVAITGSSTTGGSDGLVITAGTNTSDYPLAINNHAGTSLVSVNGYGNVNINPQNYTYVGLNVGGTIASGVAPVNGWALDCTGGANATNEVTIANNGIFTIPVGSGLLSCYPESTTSLGTCLAWLVYGGVSFIVGGTGFTASAGTSGKVNIYYNGSNYVIQNLSGSAVTISVGLIRLRSFN